MIADNLKELKDLPLWVNYILYPRGKDAKGNDKGYSKPPINPNTLWNGYSDQPGTWVNYAEAYANIGKTASYKPPKTSDGKQPPTYKTEVHGVGIVTTDGYCGIDLDHVIEDGKIVAPIVWTILEGFDTYTEISVSGTGLHLILYAPELSEDLGGKWHIDGNGEIDKKSPYEIEIYAYKNGGGRFLAVTENPYPGYNKPINKERGHALEGLYRDYRGSKNEAKKNTSASSPVEISSTDAEVLERMFRSKNGLEIERLYNGDTSGHADDHSSADLALCNYLAYWTNGNAAQMDSIFRSSGLMRDKWDRPMRNGGETYGEYTINTALTDFTPYTRNTKSTNKILSWDDEIGDGEEFPEGFFSVEASQEATEGTVNTAEEELFKSISKPAEGTTEGEIDGNNIMEPEIIDLDTWEAGQYKAVIFTVDDGKAENRRKTKPKKGNYSDYIEGRSTLHLKGVYILHEEFLTEDELKRYELPGLLTFEAAKEIFVSANDNYIQLESFPKFSETAKIKVHDNIIIAGRPGGGKSSLALNIINDLNKEYPVIYFNLEMDNLTVMQRLVKINTGLTDQTIDSYQRDSQAERLVNDTLKEITNRKPLQIVNYVDFPEVKYIEGVEKFIQTITEKREEPTIVIVDHAILLKTKEKTDGSRYTRFTEISETTRDIARKYNIVLFSLAQQNRDGQADGKEPDLSSLKESGSWENDATHALFLWEDTIDHTKKLSLRKNRNGALGRWTLDYNPSAQIYKEAAITSHAWKRSREDENGTKRDQERNKYERAFRDVKKENPGKEITVKMLAEYVDLRTETVIKNLKEYCEDSLEISKNKSGQYIVTRIQNPELI